MAPGIRNVASFTTPSIGPPSGVARTRGVATMAAVSSEAVTEILGRSEDVLMVAVIRDSRDGPGAERCDVERSF